MYKSELVFANSIWTWWSLWVLPNQDILWFYVRHTNNYLSETEGIVRTWRWRRLFWCFSDRSSDYPFNPELQHLVLCFVQAFSGDSGETLSPLPHVKQKCQHFYMSFSDPKESVQRQVNIHQFNREVLMLLVAARQSQHCRQPLRGFPQQIPVAGQQDVC